MRKKELAMSLEKKTEDLELLIKLLSSQISRLEERISTLEFATIRSEQNKETAEVKVRSKLDYLLKEIQKLRE